LAIDGPLGSGGAGFLFSFRAGYPGWIAPRHDQSYLDGDTRDVLAKLESRLLGGSMRLLLYETGNSIASSARSETSSPLRNAFEWGSRSLGAAWSRQAGATRIGVQAWSATSEAEATWLGTTPAQLTAGRADLGVLLTTERRRENASTAMGVRLERSHTKYLPASLDNGSSRLDFDVSTPVATAFLTHDQTLGPRLGARAAMSASAATGGLYLNLVSQLRFRPADAVTVSFSHVRAHQFAQSLRNTESVVGNVFPVELYVGAGEQGIPVARNDREILGVDFRPTSNLGLRAQAYLSHSTGLLLVAPSTGGPFATEGFATGSGTAPGVVLDATLRGSRYGLLASYNWQRVRLQYADSSYRPAYDASHRFELGGIFFPTATSSVRMGLTGALGRRATDVSGDFEWEACNLLDRGCEFSGSPESVGPLGGTRLPGYLRLDLGARQHWHLRLAGRDVTVALYGTMSNVLGRTNVLTVATDSQTGRRTAIEMRPRAPLVIGLDWRF
jgi:hypothetical protein